MTDTTSTDPTESLTDPAALADDPGDDYDETEDDSHFEMNRDNEGVAIVGITNDDGELALASFEQATVVPHAVVEPGRDFAAVAHEAADELLGVDVTLDDVVRVRRKVSTDEASREQAVAYDVVFSASAADDGALPDEVTSCQVEATGWFDGVPEALPGNEMRDDAELFLG
jgi:hypothetical protein